MFAIVLSFLMKQHTDFHKILELIGVGNDRMLKFKFWWLQFQGLGKYETIEVIVTQNMFENNSPKKLAHRVFAVFT